MSECDRNTWNDRDMSDTTARVLRLLSLLQTRRTWPGPELMDRLGVSERTLRRDIDRLRGLGYPVSGWTGPAGGYRLEAGADVPPLVVDDDEAVAIALGLRTAANGTVRGIEETSLRALAKLEQVLPPKARARVEALQSAVVPWVREWATVDVEALTVVAQACRERERIRFEYRDRYGDATERHVEPHHLVSIRHRWYLVAYDRDRVDWRTFRLDRMASPRPTVLRFDPRPLPGGDAAAYVLQAMETMTMRHQAEVVVDSPAEDVIGKLGAGALVEPLDEGRCLLRIQGDSLEWLLFTLIWLDAAFEVREPAELRHRAARLADRLAAAAGR